jgi:cation diffusion facilitator family transporter
MTPQRRSALVSVAAAATLVALKLSAGLASSSLGLISEAAHSGTDLVAALLTYFSLRVAERPADVTHQFGHGKAEHLSALGEATFLALVSAVISVRAIERLVGVNETKPDLSWYVFLVVAVVIVIDASRAVLSRRTARRFQSAALSSNALHFGSDLAGSVAVMIGLIATHYGYPGADAIAALFVGVLVMLAAARLAKVNVDVLMDRAPTDAEAAAVAAIEQMDAAVELRRLRMRQAGARQFADVVIAVPPTAAVGQGHAAADAVEAAVAAALPNADVVVHVEPLEVESLRERALAAAVAVPGIREVHNLSLLDVDGRTELTLHAKLPGEMSLDEAHAIAEQLEAAVAAAVPEISGVQTHLEPLTEQAAGREVESEAADAVTRIVEAVTGGRPRELRFVRTDDGLVAFLTLGLDGASRLAEAHARASEIEEEIRRERPEIADVIVHTEP